MGLPSQHNSKNHLGRNYVLPKTTCYDVTGIPQLGYMMTPEPDHHIAGESKPQTANLKMVWLVKDHYSV